MHFTKLLFLKASNLQCHFETLMEKQGQHILRAGAWGLFNNIENIWTLFFFFGTWFREIDFNTKKSLT